MKKAFTLIEVNLAILVMAGGVLSVVALYSLGFRESRQSREDVTTSAYADAVLGPLVGALSDASWDTFKAVTDTPADGWGGFLDNDGTVKRNTDADNAMSELAGIEFPPENKFVHGLVVKHEKNSGIIKIGFRASKKLDTLLSAPLYYTEVRYQGVVDSTTSN